MQAEDDSGGRIVLVARDALGGAGLVVVAVKLAQAAERASRAVLTAAASAEAVAAAMVCILSAFNGIEDLVKDLFGTLDADVALVPSSGAVIPEDWGSLLNDVPGVVSWAAVLEDEVVLRADEAVRVSTLLGVDSRYRQVAHIDNAIVEGVYAVDDSSRDLTCACLGLGVRSELALRSDADAPPLFSLSAPIRGRNLARQRERAFRTRGAHACGTFSIK